MSKTRTEVPAPASAPPVEVIPAKPGAPETKLADVAVTITPENVEFFLGLKVAGFTLWDNGTEGTGVQVPSRPFTINGERRYYSVLRSPNGDTTALDPLKQYILNAYWHPETNV
jgi:hypothetical protein